jgi:Phage tail tube protein, GTA-gp10
MANYIDLDFADGEYRFALPLAQIDELQRKCNAGIGSIFARTVKGAHRAGDEIILAPGQAEFYAADLIETIRQGLIGGKMGTVDGQTVEVNPPIAKRLVDNYVLNQPLSDAWELAVAILGAVIVGYTPPETPGKKGSAAAKKTPAKTQA